MGLTLIFSWKSSGRRVPRSEQEKELRSEGWGGTMTDEQLDKLKFAERKIERADGDKAPFVRAASLDKIDSKKEKDNG